MIELALPTLAACALALIAAVLAMGKGEMGSGVASSAITKQDGTVGGGRGVAFSRTSGGAAESSFTTTTVTLPQNAIPKGVIVVCGTQAMVQVTASGKQFFAGVVTPNVPLKIPLKELPAGTSVDVQTQILAATTTIAGVVAY